MSWLLGIIVCLPLFGMVFALISKESVDNNRQNALKLGIFTIISNIFILFILAQQIDITNLDWQLVKKIEWLKYFKIELVFGIDFFSWLLITGVHIAVLIGMLGINKEVDKQKELVVFSLFFLSTISGYFISTDLFSFYIFFEAMMLPLFMLIGILGEIKKYQVIYRLFIYNLLGATILFVSLMVLYSYQNVGISEVGNVVLSQNIEVLIWGAIFVSFLSRIPIWPTHQAISAVSVNIDNPLVFIIANIFPLTGVYGLVRFFPISVPEVLSPYLFAFELLVIITVVIVALVGFVNKDINYKIFAYLIVFYLFYLLGGLISPNNELLNIGFSMFALLIVFSCMVIMVNYIERLKLQEGLKENAILFNNKKATFILSFLILAAVGMPLSSLFLNNIATFAMLYRYNIEMTVFLLFAMILVCLGLLQRLFYWKYPLQEGEATTKSQEINMPNTIFVPMIIFMLVLILSLINPTWFLV